MTTLPVRVIPKAKRNETAGWVEVDGKRVLRVRLTAPPVEGKANKALVEFLAATLGLRKGDIQLQSGEKSRMKTLRIAAREDEVLRRLGG